MLHPRGCWCVLQGGRWTWTSRAATTASRRRQGPLAHAYAPHLMPLYVLLATRFACHERKPLSDADCRYVQQLMPVSTAPDLADGSAGCCRPSGSAPTSRRWRPPQPQQQHRRQQRTSPPADRAHAGPSDKASSAGHGLHQHMAFSCHTHTHSQEDRASGQWILRTQQGMKGHLRAACGFRTCCVSGQAISGSCTQAPSAAGAARLARGGARCREVRGDGAARCASSCSPLRCKCA